MGDGRKWLQEMDWKSIKSRWGWLGFSEEEFCFVKRSRFAMEAERVHLDEKFEFVSS